ncbi:MAG: hypothetical protein NVS4B8_26440 [Herpetosiphon sp.]
MKSSHRQFLLLWIIVLVAMLNYLQAGRRTLMFSSLRWPWASKAKAFFPLGIFEDGGLTNEPDKFATMIQNVRAHNLDTVLFTNNSLLNDASLLAVSDRLNFNVIFAPHGDLNRPWWFSSTPPSLASATTLAQPITSQLGAHPSLKGYNLVDDGRVEWQAKITAMTQAFKQLDPDRLVMGFFPPTPEIFNRAAAPAQPSVQLTYQYPAGRNQQPCDFLRGDGGSKDLVDLLREEVQFRPPGMPLWVVLQTHTTIRGPNDPDPTALRVPTVEELRLQNWLALGEGATGLFWFIYSTEQMWQGLHDNPTLYAEVASLARRVGPLRSTLLTLQKKPDQFVASAPEATYISTFQQNTTKHYYVIAANHHCQPQKLTITAPMLHGTLRDVETNQLYALGTPIPFAGGDGKLFEVLNVGATTLRTKPAPAANLITNGSFEELSDTGAPAQWGLPGASVDSTTVHSGRAALRFDGPANDYASQTIMLKPHTKYMVSFWAKTEQVTALGIGVRYPLGAPNTQILGSTWRRGTLDWIRTVAYFTTPANYASGRFDLVWNLNAGERAWIDDVSLCEASLPSCR